MSQGLTQKYLELAGVIFVALNAKGEITQINRKGCSILGYEAGELIGENWFDTCLPANQRSEVKGIFRELMQGEIESLEYYYNAVLTKSGEERFISWHNMIMHDESGKPIGTLSSGQDITERRQAEEALQESKRSLSMLMSNLPGMVYRCRNDQDWTMEFVSEGSFDLTGYKPSDLIGTQKLAYGNLIPVDDRQNVWERVQEAVAKRQTFQLVYRINTATGEQKWVWEQGQGVFAKGGELLALEGFVTDITDRLRAENALKESEARIRAIVKMAVDGIITIDERGTIETFNRAAERLFGYNVDEVIGENIRILMPLPYRQEHDSYLENYMTTGEKKIIGIGREVVGQRKDGTTFPLYLAVSEIDLADRRIFTGIVRDLTQQKTLQQQIIQSERLAVIGKMAAKVAHEVRNPLSSISLNAELLEDEIQSRDSTSIDEARALLKSMIAEIDRVSALTDEYLQFSRLPETRPGRGTFKELIDETMEFLGEEFSQKKVEFEFKDSKPSFFVRIDRTQFRRVLINIIRNALESMPKGGKLEIWVEKNARNGVINIMDTGVGIPNEKVEQIFEPFFTTKDFGTGLGLAISQQVVQEHGGRISCSSREGRGTTFQIEIPLAPDS